MKRILILGGLGFIGSNLVRKLQDTSEYEITIVDSYTRYAHRYPTRYEDFIKLGSNVKKIILDVTSDYLSFIDNVNFDIIVNFVSQIGVAQSQYELRNYLHGNIISLGCVLEDILKGKLIAKQVIHASSRAVYGEGMYLCKLCNARYYPEVRKNIQEQGFEICCPNCSRPSTPLPQTEDTMLKPVSFYGLTKKHQEDILEWFYKLTGTNITILRIFNAFGEGQSIHNPYAGVIPAFVKQVIKNKEIEIYEDGKILRDFIYISDVVDGFISVFNLEGFNVFNLGSSQQTSLQDLAQLIINALQVQSRVNITGKYRIGDIRACVADIKKIQSRGFRIKVSIEEGIQLFVSNLSFVNDDELTDNSLEKAELELLRFGILKQ